MEKDYLRDVIIPLLKQELEPMVEKMRNQFNMAVSYNRGGGLDIQLLESAKQSMNLVSGSEESGYRKKKYIIRVKFPNNRISCHEIVSNTFVDVIKYAGAKNVERLGIMNLGDNIISTTLMENRRYAAAQQEIEPGLYVNTYCDTDRKIKILKKINRELNLNLVIEKELIED